MKIINNTLPEHFVAWLTKHPDYLPSVSKVTFLGNGAMALSDADFDNDPEDSSYSVTDPTTGLNALLGDKKTALEEIAACEKRLCEMMLGTNIVREPIEGEEDSVAEIQLRDRE